MQQMIYLLYFLQHIQKNLILYDFFERSFSATLKKPLFYMAFLLTTPHLLVRFPQEWGVGNGYRTWRMALWSSGEAAIVKKASKVVNF